MKFKSLAILSLVIIIIAIIASTLSLQDTVIKAGNYKSSVNTALHMNALYQLENGYYTAGINGSIKHFGGGILFDNPNATGYLIIKKDSPNCHAPLSNLSICPTNLYSVNVEVKNNDSGIMQLTTSIYRSKSEAERMFSLILSSLNESKNDYGILIVNDSNSIGSDIGPYVNKFAVLNEPYNYNRSQRYLHVLLLRRDNILLTSLIINSNLSSKQGISEPTLSDAKMTYLLNNYYLS